MIPYFEAIHIPLEKTYDFVNEIQDLGCVEPNCLLYNTLGGLDNWTMYFSFLKAIRRFYLNMKNLLKDMKKISTADNSIFQLKYPFLETIKMTFEYLHEYIKAVQNVGCIEKSVFCYRLVAGLKNQRKLGSYKRSVSKLLVRIETAIYQLDDPSQAFEKNGVVTTSFPESSFLEILRSGATSFPDLKRMPIRQKNPFLNSSEDSSNSSSNCVSSISESNQGSSSSNYNQVMPCKSLGSNSPVETVENGWKQCEDLGVIQETSSVSTNQSSSAQFNTSSDILTIHGQNGPQQTSNKISNLEFYYGKCVKCKYLLPSDGKIPPTRDDVCYYCKKSKEEAKPKKRSKNYSHSCPSCSRVFRTWKHLSLHTKKVHSDGDPCDNLSSNEFTSDNGNSSSLPVHCCKTCNSASLTFASFQTHRCRLPTEEGVEGNPNLSNKILITNLTKLEQMKRFVCTICQVEFRALNRIVYHLPRCTPGPYTCNHCTNSFTSGKELNYHKKKAHRTEKCYDCKECGKAFKLMSSLRKHCVTSHESKALMDSMVVQNGTSYRCDVCHKKFIKRIFLTNHQIRNHGLDKNFLCQVCGNRFMTRNSLNTHMSIHEDEKKFECQYCGNKFRAKEKLLHHERTHTGERPYVCSRCEKTFVSQTKLNEHMGRHEARKRFHCPHCKKSYASLWDLKTHSNSVHPTSERVFATNAMVRIRLIEPISFHRKSRKELKAPVAQRPPYLFVPLGDVKEAERSSHRWSMQETRNVSLDRLEDLRTYHSRCRLIGTEVPMADGRPYQASSTQHIGNDEGLVHQSQNHNEVLQEAQNSNVVLQEKLNGDVVSRQPQRLTLVSQKEPNYSEESFSD